MSVFAPNISVLLIYLAEYPDWKGGMAMKILAPTCLWWAGGWQQEDKRAIRVGNLFGGAINK
jgi:hypothetical protein